MIIFTSICANYLHKARTLAKSVKENIPDATFIVSLLETEMKNKYKYDFFDDIVLAKDYWGMGFEKFIFKHTIVEASTAVKGRFFQYLYERFPNENKFIYLDPDVYVYSDFVELRKLLNERPIILCPHLLQYGNIDMELSSTAHGVYNLGFLAVNRMAEAREFINWWADRLSLYCYDDKERGIFTDQKWIDLAPCFFDVEIFKHRGYDFAPWSLLNCGMYKKDGKYYIKGDELRFIHFSGYGATAEKCMREWLPDKTHPFYELYRAYSEKHEFNNSDKISTTPWSYDFYKSGEKVKNEIRFKYRKSQELMNLCENPFEKSNSFYKKYKIEKEAKRYKLKKYIFRAKEIYKEKGFTFLYKKIKQKTIR